MKKAVFLLLMLCLCFALVSCANTGSDIVEIPGAGIIPNPDSNMFKENVGSSEVETEDEALDPYSAEQESMKGSAVIELPVVPVEPEEEN